MKRTLFDLVDNKPRAVLDFKIPPIGRHLEQSLFRHLLATVDTSGNPEESVNIVTSPNGKKDCFDTIQYQFGKTEPMDQYIRYVEDTIEREFFYWLAKMDGYYELNAT